MVLVTFCFFPSVHGKEPLPVLDASEVQDVRKELVSIRDKVNVLLNAIDGNPKKPVGTEGRDGSRASTGASTSNTSQDTVVKSDTTSKKGVVILLRIYDVS